MEPTACMTEKSEMAERLAIHAVNDPHHIVHDVGNINKVLRRTRECEAACRSPVQCLRCDGELSQKLSIFREYLNAVGAAISGIDHAVIRHGEGQMISEILRRFAARSVLEVLRDRDIL